MFDKKEYMKEYRRRNRSKLTAQDKAWRQKRPLYNVWTDMRRRCDITKGASVDESRNYIERGITMCVEWQRSYDVFEKWCLENGWREGFDIDRIDNDGNYEPTNCRFVSRSVNSRNRRSTIRCRGVPIIEFYDAYANEDVVPYGVFYKRVQRFNWPMEKALYTKVK